MNTLRIVLIAALLAPLGLFAQPAPVETQTCDYDAIVAVKVSGDRLVIEKIEHLSPALSVEKVRRFVSRLSTLGLSDGALIRIAFDAKTYERIIDSVESMNADLASRQASLFAKPFNRTPSPDRALNPRGPRS